MSNEITNLEAPPEAGARLTDDAIVGYFFLFDQSVGHRQNAAQKKRQLNSSQNEGLARVESWK